jgi:hypothetical protein
MGFKTKTILAVPIFNKMDEVDGVIQAINKKEGSKGEQLYFDRVDHGILEMVSNLSGNNIFNTIQYNQQLETIQNMRSVMNITVRLLSAKTDIALFSRTRVVLNELFFTNKSSLWIVNPKTSQTLYTITKEEQRLEQSFIGILGEVANTKETLSVFNPISDRRFNGSQLDPNLSSHGHRDDAPPPNRASSRAEDEPALRRLPGSLLQGKGR